MRRTIAGLVAALTLTLVPAVALAAPAARAGDPDYNKPTVGDCHDYTYDQMYADSDTSPAVPCTDSHTGHVIAVPRVPDTVSWSDTAALARIVDKKCDPAYYAALGRNQLTRALTAYGQAFFIPTADEQAQGARWIRCDVFLWRGTKLSPLPFDTAPLIPQPLTATVRRCLTSKDYATTCDATHVYKATGDFNIHKNRYPTRATMIRIGRAKCPALTTTRTYRFFWPSKAAWKDGYKVMVCYSKTRH